MRRRTVGVFACRTVMLGGSSTALEILGMGVWCPFGLLRGMPRITQKAFFVLWTDVTNATGGGAMRKYNFTLIASGIDPALNEIEVDRLYEAGCDDATVSTQKGFIVLEFDREGRNFISALFSAIANVQKAGGVIERIEPDHLVSASEIAKRCGLGRAAISLYAAGERREGFPRPIARVTTESPLWDWVEVASWLHQRNRLDRATAVQARLVRVVNRAIERPPRHAIMRRRIERAGQSLEAA